MNFDLTRSNLFATTLYSLVLLVVFWGSGSSIAGSVAQIANPDPYMISSAIEQTITLYPHLFQTLSALLAFVCSMMVARLVVRNVLYLERTYMPSLLFVIISSSFYVAGESFLPLSVAFLLLLALSLIFRSYSVKNLATGIYLTVGFYFGLAALIYPASAYLILMLPVGLATFRISNIKEGVSCLVGLLLPMGLFLYTLWSFGGDVALELERYFGELAWHDNITAIIDHLTILDYTMIGVLVVLVLFSYVIFLTSRKKYKLRGAMSYNYLVCFCIWSIIVMLVSPARTLYLLPIVAVPLSVVIPTYFASRRPTFLSNFLYALLILSAIAIHIIH